MIKQILLITCVMFLVTGCNMELKKSANNKLFDTKGFDGGKRRPVYNNKYIDRAKRNIVDNNYDEVEADIDEPDEYVDPYTQNRIMYSNMIKKEQPKKGSRTKTSQDPHDEPYPDIGHAKDLALAQGNNTQSNQDLRSELAEIKTMLSAAKKDLVKYKCPLQEPAVSKKPNSMPAIKKQAQLSPKPKKAAVNADESDDINYDEPLSADDGISNDSAAHPVEAAPTPQASAPTPAEEATPITAPAAETNAIANPVAAPPSAPVVQNVPAKATTPMHDDEIVDEMPQKPSHTAPMAQHNMINLAPTK